jgi:DNA repair protein RadD
MINTSIPHFAGNAKPVISLTLRDYQIKAVEDLRYEISWLTAKNLDPRVLLVAPTGSGKGTISCWMILSAVSRGRKILFLVNRRELVKDLSRRLYRLGVQHGIVMGSHPARPWLPVQVASIDTLHRRPHIPQADLIFLDEAHFSISPIWAKVIARYPGVPLIGMTATPVRADGRGLGDLYNAIVQCPDTAELTALGHLAPARIFAPSKPDLTGVKMQAGEYNQKQLATAVDRGALVGDIVTHWKQLAAGRPTVVFAVNVAHAEHITEQFLAAGITSQCVDANTPDHVRDKLWSDLACGAVQVCTSVGVISYGWDVPAVSCAILARPTKSLALYLQQIGRVLRTAPGKTDALILDHAGCVLEHGLPDDPHEWTLDGERKKTAKQERAPSVRSCLKCWYTYRSQMERCPNCGFTPPKHDTTPDTVEGNLVEVTESAKYVPGKIADDPVWAYFQQEAVRLGKNGRWPWVMKELWRQRKLKHTRVPEDVIAAHRKWLNGSWHERGAVALQKAGWTA